MLANEPIRIRLRDVEVIVLLYRHIERLHIYLKLVVRGVVQAPHCGAVLIMADFASWC